MEKKDRQMNVNSPTQLARTRLRFTRRRSLHLLGAFVLAALLVTGKVGTAAAQGNRVQALVPGLSVQQLPVALNNVNSIAYGPDGRLYAAAYDGTVFVLTDTDDDGLEDHVETFWKKAGDLLTPVGLLVNEDGAYVSSRGKVSLLKDTDGDGLADVSEVVVSGWQKEQHNSDTRNDAAGFAIDADGNLYFSLGCMSYDNEWQLDQQGVSHYDINSERGTILKVSPDHSQRQILATGLRFVIGMDFNKYGDLFATDQEGATYFPGGNPRDELLHIIPGRHYGFPFRHAQYLPDVIDEPSIVDFSPQHQSTCGFRFNELRDHRQPFGPEFWEGNAIVTGFSRGKLWRVPLAKTRAGYVGQQIQLLSFETLPTDVAVTPRGDLLVTCHSGHPDWGSGPGSSGRLYRVSYDASCPQPVAAWSAGPLEVKIAFDQPIAADRLGEVKVQMGDFVWEGDEVEWQWPGYEVVAHDREAIRREVAISQTQVSEDGRTVTLTAGQPWRTRYAIKLPGVVAADGEEDRHGEPAFVSFEHHGAQAEWTPEGKSAPAWTGWLPHIDSNVINTLTNGSAENEKLSELLSRPGLLKIHARLHLPGQHVVMRFESSGEFALRCGEQELRSHLDGQRQVAELTADSPSPQKPVAVSGDHEMVQPGDERELEITIQTGVDIEGQPETAYFFDASYHADFDPYERPFRLEHIWVPWAPTLHPPQSEDARRRSLAKLPGDPQKGREIFFGEEAKCSTCHTYNGQGGKVAANLSGTAYRAPDAVLRDILEPSAAINPDYISYMIQTTDGKVLTGLLQSADPGHVTLIDSNAKAHELDRDDIEVIQPSPISLMPIGFDKLGKDKLQDLVAFLCTEDTTAKAEGKPTGLALWQYWSDFHGDRIEDLTALETFPDQPTATELVPALEIPSNFQEHFGSRVQALIYPPQTGNYRFWVAADDYAQLFLSTSTKPDDKQSIVEVHRWTASRDWEHYPEQRSKPIHLEAGKAYYLEVLQVEETSLDCLAVGWELPDGTMERPIPGSRLSTPLDE